MAPSQNRPIYILARKLNILCVVLASAALFAISALTTVDVILRYFFLSPIPAAVEICGLIEPYVILLPFGFTLAIGQHVRVGLLTCRFPVTIQLVLEFFALFLILGVSILLAVFGGMEFASSYAINEFIMAPIILPAWAGKFSQPLGWSILAFQAAVSMLKAYDTYKEEAAAWTP